MKPHRLAPVPDLDEGIEAHANAVQRGDEAAAESFLASRAIEGHRAALKVNARLLPLTEHQVLARARIGFQYVAKVRWRGERGELLLQNRWSQQDGKWLIVEVEDLTRKRSSWSDVPPYKPRPLNGEARRA